MLEFVRAGTKSFTSRVAVFLYMSPSIVAQYCLLSCSRHSYVTPSWGGTSASVHLILVPGQTVMFEGMLTVLSANGSTSWV